MKIGEVLIRLSGESKSRPAGQDEAGCALRLPPRPDGLGARHAGPASSFCQCSLLFQQRNKWVIDGRFCKHVLDGVV